MTELEELAVDDLVKRLRDTSNDPYFHLTPGVQDWLQQNDVLRDKAAAAILTLIQEKREMEEALKQIIGVVSYPVATEICPRGWNERRIDPSGCEHIAEIAFAAFTPGDTP